QIQQRLRQSHWISAELRQRIFHPGENLDFAGRGFRPQQLANMRDNLFDVHRLQIQRRWSGELQEMFDDAVEAVQFSLDDLEARSQKIPELWRQAAKIFFEQLDVDIK